MEKKYKTKFVLGSTSKGDFEKRYGEIRTFQRVSPKKFEITYFPKCKIIKDLKSKPTFLGVKNKRK